VAAATSFLARAEAAGQPFRSWQDFADAARGGGTRSKPEDWLPLDLLQNTLRLAPGDVKWSLEPAPGGTRVVATLPEGRRLVGRYTLESGRVKEVTVIRTPNPEP
jgi:hypothetical protein